MHSPEVTADHVVVGSGVVAAAVALELAGRLGTVALVGDLGDRTGQASAAAGAMLGVFSEAGADEVPAERDAEVAERLAARRRYDGWLASLHAGDRPPLRVDPGVAVIANALGDDDRAGLAAIRAAAANAGATAEDLDPTGMPGYRPAPEARALDAVHLPDEGSVDTATLLEALALTLRAHAGVTVVDDRVTSLAGTTVTTRDGRRVQGATVVLAPGAGGTLLDDPELDLPFVFAGRGVSALVRGPVPGPAMAIRTPNRAFACGLHLVPRRGGLTYLGATNRLSTEADLDHEPTIEEIATVLDGTSRELDRRLGRAGVLAVRVGHRPVTADRLPLVGRTAQEHVLVATGTYRNGILLAPHLADLIAGEVDHPGALAAHRWRPDRPFVAPDLDALLEAGLDGLVGHLRDGDRRDELRGLLLAALRGNVGDGQGHRSVKAAARLLQRAPMTEVLPLVVDLLSRPR